MTENRWVRAPATDTARSAFHPSLPSLEVAYFTDPDVLAAVLPPPLQPPAEPRVHARVTEIDLQFGQHRHQERVAYFAVANNASTSTIVGDPRPSARRRGSIVFASPAIAITRCPGSRYCAATRRTSSADVVSMTRA